MNQNEQLNNELNRAKNELNNLLVRYFQLRIEYDAKEQEIKEIEKRVISLFSFVSAIETATSLSPSSVQSVSNTDQDPLGAAK